MGKKFAKSSEYPTQAAAIRAYLAKYPDSSPADLSRLLKAELGLSVTPGAVSTTKSQAKKAARVADEVAGRSVDRAADSMKAAARLTATSAPITIPAVGAKFVEHGAVRQYVGANGQTAEFMARQTDRVNRQARYLDNLLVLYRGAMDAGPTDIDAVATAFAYLVQQVP